MSTDKSFAERSKKACIPIGAAYDREDLNRSAVEQAIMPNDRLMAESPMIWFPLKEGHVLMVAGAGSAKSTGFASPVLLSYQGPMIVNDAPGELYARCSRRRRELGQKVFRFTDDPLTTSTFNPCEDIAEAIDQCDGSDDAIVRVFSKALLKGSMMSTWFENPTGNGGGGGGSNKFFEDNAAGLIKAIFAMLVSFKLCPPDDVAAKDEMDQLLETRLIGQDVGPAEVDKLKRDLMTRPDPDLKGVYQVLSLGADSVQAWLSVPAAKLLGNDYLAVELAQLKNTYAGMDKRTFNSVHSTAHSSMMLMGQTSVREAFAGSREAHGDRYFSLEDFRTGKWTIFNGVLTKIPQVDLGILRVLFFGIGGWILDRDPFPLKPVLMLDEAHLIERCPWLIQQIAYARKYLSLILIYQDHGQIQTYWGSSKPTLYGNCALQLYSGISDHEAAKFVSDLVGTSTIEERSISHSNGSPSQSSSLKERKELPIDEVLSLNKRDLQVAVMPPLHCAIIGKLFYRNRREFDGLWDRTAFD